MKRSFALAPLPLLGPAVLGVAVLVAGCLRSGRVRELHSAHHLVGVRAALRAGDIERAEQLLDQARQRFPGDGAVRLWSSEVAAMRWDDRTALRDLQVVRATPGHGGLTEAELEGKIGDLLFRVGRYGQSVPHLYAGQVGRSGAARKAWAQIAQELPFLRTEPQLEVAELPLIEGPLPQMLCGVGDRELPFVLDTRATFTTLSRSLATALEVSPVLPAGHAVDGIGRRIPSSIGILRRFRLGPVEIGPLPVLIVSDSALALRDHSGGASRSPQALLGQDVLRRFWVSFDPARRSVVLQRAGQLPESSSIPCLSVEETLVVPVHIEGRLLWFALDTGASASSLSVEGLAVLPAGESRAVASLRRIYSPSGTRLSVRTVRGLTLRASEVVFRGVDLPVVDRGPTSLFPIHGVLGADLLMRCRTTIDQGRARLEVGG